MWHTETALLICMPKFLYFIFQLEQDIDDFTGHDASSISSITDDGQVPTTQHSFELVLVPIVIC